ncbi:hypothetical protein SAMN04488040_1901 [Sulfitobacter marinus]|uniref:Uncharacterized protein n=1 Tax=Sulfitobacter marinus TaxID=394264 RepID=A0A1I6SVZ5_9RHOB|nr:hypothetical protein [Sulfitobacter marinus]SFS81144.1 hypothetical protein SAMN04488040_1901 [Sulfitobacter marinus]
MTDQAMSEAAMLISLRDITLPVEAAGRSVADIVVTVGLAGVLALIIAGVLRLFSMRRPAAGSDLRAQILAIADMPDDARRVALLHLFREAQPERYAAIKGALYQPEGGVDIATLEAEVARLV